MQAFWALTPEAIEKAKVDVTINQKTLTVQWPPNKELKKRVWETPVNRLAKEMGVSDNAIRKHCKKQGIALPGNDHWQKVRNQREKK